MSDIRRGNKVKLSKKLLKNFSVIAVVSILLTAVFSTATFWFVFSDEQEAEVRQYTDKIISVYNSDSEIDLSKYYGIGDFRVTLIKSDGSVVSDSVDTDVNSMPNHSDRPEFEQAIKDGNGSSHRMSETLNKITYYYAEKTADGSVIRVAKTIDSIYGIFLFVIPSILIIMIGVFVVCTILAKRSTKKIIEPIKEMADNGNGSPYDELLPLSQKIASQQRQIKRQMRRLQFEKDKISTLIENMAEGFILIDVDKKVLMSNYSASKLLGADDDGVTDKTLIAFSRNEVLNDCVDKALSGESKNGDTTVKGRALQIITNPVYSNGEKNGAICLIIDVSAKKKAEKMRREFTANVTHELKTPLTSISGYAEIIASGLVKPDDIPNFANKIHKESGRLLSLISDIMELSQLDEKFSDEEFAPVDLAGVAAEVAEDLRSNAEKHGITITVDTKTAVINGNRNQIYELIYNLCDNAIRYNRENGSVKIMTGDDNEHPFVKVADTGIGIPEKHHKRVFERFYRVDKSRSKETGGTGLGLAIVKHITERHGGEISLESSEQGTTFTARF
ncbi:PAS domain S-box protein [Ruminococcus bromii]|nr:PAS domain S-box protein [Ruminococcus bromii]MTR79961.1 PAS domain S-box protein [Ruminococcus bromii]MTR89151.1 PAS domain S-box protein [Ruminococcus bromii]